MAAPIRIDELTATASLSAAAAVAIVQGGSTLRATAAAFITQAESFVQSGIGVGTPVTRTVQAKLLEVKTTADFTGAAAGLTGVGTDVLNANTTGEFHTAVGFNALKANTTGASIVAIGYRALTNNTTGNFNTAVGKDALFSNTTGLGNTGIGETSLLTNTTGAANTALGEAALYNNNGDGNTALGRSSLADNTTGNNNTAVGYLAMNKNTTAANNTAVGMQALFTAVGGNGYNVAVGEAAMFLCTTGQKNVSVGQGSLPNLTTGANNVVVGADTGGGITTGSGNTIVGYNVTGLAAGLTNNIILASGDGVKAQHDGTKWTLTGGAFFDADGNTGIDSSGADILNVKTGGTERARVSATGYTKIGNAGTYIGATSAYHEMVSNSANNPVGLFSHSHATTPLGFYWYFSGGAPNDNTQYYLQCVDTGATRATIWSSGALTACQGLAIPAGGTAGRGYMFSTTSNYGVFFGSGAPSLAAAKGSLYLRSDGTTTNDRAYINTDGSTTWTALTTAA